MWAAASSALCQAQLGWMPRWPSFALQPLAQSSSHLPYRKPSFRNCSFRMSLYWSKPPSMRVTVAFSHTHSSWHTRRMKRSSWDTRIIPPCQYTRAKIRNLVEHKPGPRTGGVEILCLCLALKVSISSRENLTVFYWQGAHPSLSSLQGDRRITYGGAMCSSNIFNLHSQKEKYKLCYWLSRSPTTSRMENPHKVTMKRCLGKALSSIS